MLVIGIDPSLTATGLCAIDLTTMQVVDWTCIRTKPSATLKATDALAQRLVEVADGVRAFFAKHATNGRFHGAVVIEGQVGSSFGKMSSMSTIFLLGAGYGACMGALPVKPIVLHSSTIKARTLGSREKTTKQAAWEAVRGRLLALPADPKNKVALEAVHDAVITALAGLPEVEQLQALLPDLTR